uniref:putative ubiquitin-conjugating enzyme E2 38 n=1 Tax=Erigeron canadensis TaxID=72917 RepID=UPI001CB8CD75|nr:putative ubiquitin-conjugating enzyme E2 38 [Erigeron canadensis]
MFVRVYLSRMDLLRAVIIGPEGTPYQDGVFVFDVLFPDDYPNSPARVRYHSGGLAINPSMKKCGEVCLNLYTPTGRPERLWGPHRNMLQILVYIQDLLMNTKPYFNGLISASFRGSVAGEWLSLLYNENTIIKSLKTMVYTINKPPKNFEDLVVGHFHKHVRDILTTCKAYMEGLQAGCLVSDNNDTCSIVFKNDVASCIKSLIDAFKRIGAKEAEEFLYLIKKRKVVVDEDLNDVVDKKGKLQDIEIRRDSDHCYVPWNIFAYRGSVVGKVLVKEGMWVERGQPLYISDTEKLNEVLIPTSGSAILSQSAFKKVLCVSEPG